MHARLYTAELGYGSGITLHTASSGSVATLQELYLVLDDGRCQGVGEVRINIAYLNGYSPRQVLHNASAVLSRLELDLSPEALLASLDTQAVGTMLTPTRCLIDCALHDLMARREGLPLADWLRRRLGGKPVTVPEGGHALLRWPTNQTLFWSPFEVFMRQAEDYVARGFRDLKVRIAAGDFAEDLRRLHALRERFGDAVTLSADANAQWPRHLVRERLAALAPLRLDYVEQPTVCARPADLLELADASPMPLMVDEGLQGATDVDEIASFGGRLWAHLKLIKLGGLGPSLAAARKLKAAGVPFMVGQMNEGGAATAAALHLACAVEARHAELYGADGLAQVPAGGLHYADGHLGVPRGPGLGIHIDLTRMKPQGVLA